MDGAGGAEVRLVRKKGKKRPLAEAPAPAGRGREAEGSRDRFQALLRDYHDLLKDTEEKKRRLQSLNQRKLGLLAEVRFLQKKYISFAHDDAQQAHRLKKQRRKVPSPEGRNDALAFRVAAAEVPCTSKNTNLDLNEDSLMNDKGADRQGQDHSEHLKLAQAGVEEDMVTTAVNLSVCRDTGNPPTSDDKRAVAWQELKV